MTGLTSVFAYGEHFGYLVVPDRQASGTAPAGVRLTRFSIEAARDGLAAVVARESAVNVIIFPLGRGPGRPSGETEMAALAEAAKGYAERFEAGESLEGYAAWQHPRPAFRLREGETARFVSEIKPLRFAHQLPRTRPTARIQCLAYTCPTCGAGPTYPCVGPGERPVYPHRLRLDLYRREAAILDDGEGGGAAPSCENRDAQALHVRAAGLPH